MRSRVAYADFRTRTVVHGEIEKNAAISCKDNQNICLYWWPKLPEIKGWHQERESSFHYNANALAPDGKTFNNAEVVMYAAAFYKPRMPETTSLDMFVSDDKSKSIQDNPGLVISAAGWLATADGQRLKSFTFRPTKGGNWERVSYGEEGDFYLVFTISSRTKRAYEKAMPSYKSMVNTYKEKL
jgi:hypothetical protein